jgi:predicted RNA methylase
MATQPLALTLPLDDPARTAAQGIADRLSEGRSVARNDLLAGMTSAFGGSSADGSWSLRDAYDVLELAQILHLKNTTLPADANVRLAQLIAMTAALPTHSVRSETQVAFQQFSTPAPIGFLAARAAAITASDIVLEPSAGTGLLAVHGHFAGARLLLNEIDAWRARLLRHALPEGTLSTHDGELIDDMLDPQLVPSVVLINPPFSRSQGRGATATLRFATCAPRSCASHQAGAAPSFFPIASRQGTRIGCTPPRAHISGCISTCRPMPIPSTAPGKRFSSFSSKRAGQGIASHARPVRRSALRSRPSMRWRPRAPPRRNRSPAPADCSGALRGGPAP